MVRIKSIYRAEVIDAGAHEMLAAAAARMRENEVSSLAIVEDDVLVGIVTERDLVQALSEGADPRRASVGAYMTLDPLTADVEDDVAVIAMRMLEYGIRHVPVTCNGRLVGMVSARDLLILEATDSVRVA